MGNLSFKLFPDQASTLSGRVDALYFFMLAVTAFFTLLVGGLVIYFAVKYRRREGAPPPEKFESAKLELLWTVVPLLITVVMFVWGAKVAIAASRAPANAMDINVIGKQWMWHIEHPDGRKEINELTVPLGTPVKLSMTSQDVIHSFYIPDFRMKQDVVPGRYSYLWFEPSKVGTYHLFCAEYCGTLHSGMIGKVNVLAPEQYDEWLKRTPAGDSMEVKGAKLFAANSCSVCHSQRAPTLAGLYGKVEHVWAGTPDKKQDVTADEAYIRESILFPRAKIVQGYDQSLMPSYQGLLNEEQVMCLVAYIKSLGKDAKLGNDINLGNKMQELNPPAPDMSSRNSDPYKREN
jgi:cytochrome c oxidase subunit 2